MELEHQHVSVSLNPELTDLETFGVNYDFYVCFAAYNKCPGKANTKQMTSYSYLAERSFQLAKFFMKTSNTYPTCKILSC